MQKICGLIYLGESVFDQNGGEETKGLFSARENEAGEAEEVI